MNIVCDDILFLIFEYLNINDVPNVQSLSKRFNNLIKYDDLLWKTYCERDYFMKVQKELYNMSNKEKYKKCHDIHTLKQILKLNLADDIDSIMNMQELYSSRSKIIEIPKEIGQLINLRMLYLDDNQITLVTKEIGSLSKL